MKETSDTTRLTGWPPRSVAERLRAFNPSRLITRGSLAIRSCIWAWPTIHGNHAGGSPLQQHFRKAAGGSANIKTDMVLRIDCEMVERGHKLERAPRNIALRRIGNARSAVGETSCPGLVITVPFTRTVPR